ncbi:MAG: SCO family protein [Actinomycetales bacterium]|nr:SCO family protein [Actinomycetales bacterium]
MTSAPHDAPDDHDSVTSAPIISSDERSAAFHAGRTPIPPKFFLLVAVVFVVLGLGGVVLERVVGTPGQTPIASPPATTTPSSLPSTTHSILGLELLPSRPAPPITLTDQRGATWRLAAQRGRVVILAFYNQTCNDICPVLGAELRSTISLLGTNAGRVDVAIVNTDPTHAAVVALPAALVRPGLIGQPTVVFLTGTLAELDAVWTHYGVEVRVGPAPTPSLHNDLLYFITADGRLHALATPFANESRKGVFSLDAASRRAFAAGVAEVADSLLP